MNRRGIRTFLVMALLFGVVFGPILLFAWKDWRDILFLGARHQDELVSYSGNGAEPAQTPLERAAIPDEFSFSTAAYIPLTGQTSTSPAPVLATSTHGLPPSATSEDRLQPSSTPSLVPTRFTTRTPTVIGTSTPTKIPTVTTLTTPRPSPTRPPTFTPRPTETPQPTNTPRPTSTPRPTYTPRPTNTPPPTDPPPPTTPSYP